MVNDGDKCKNGTSSNLICSLSFKSILMTQEEEDFSEDEAGVEYMLGFACSPAKGPASLLRHQFPSKMGGRPVRRFESVHNQQVHVNVNGIERDPFPPFSFLQAWLDPVHLPTRDQLTCQATGQPLKFLLQVSAIARAAHAQPLRICTHAQRINSCIHMDAHTRTRIPTHTLARCLHECICKPMHERTHVCTHSHAHTHARTHACTHMMRKPATNNS